MLFIANVFTGAELQIGSRHFEIYQNARIEYVGEIAEPNVCFDYVKTNNIRHRITLQYIVVYFSLTDTYAQLKRTGCIPYEKIPYPTNGSLYIVYFRNIGLRLYTVEVQFYLDRLKGEKTLIKCSYQSPRKKFRHYLSSAGCLYVCIYLCMYVSAIEATPST